MEITRKQADRLAKYLGIERTYQKELKNAIIKTIREGKDEKVSIGHPDNRACV